MKVLILPSWYPNLKIKTGSFFKEQAWFLNKNGFDVKVLMVEELNTKSYWFQRLKRFFQIKQAGLSTNFLIQEPEAYSFPVIIQKSWSEEKKLKEMDKAYLKAFKNLTKKLHWHPEIIQMQGMFKYGLSSYLIAKESNTPLVVLEHSPFRMANYSKMHLERISRIFEIANKVAGVSHFHKASLSVVKPIRELEVVWNFMDEQKFSYQTSLKSTKKFIITTVLRPSSIKGPITFFDSIIRFIQIYNKSELVEVNVVGLSSIEELTKMKGIDENFITKYDKLSEILKFHPWLDRDAIKALHQKSSVFVSTSTQETYGVALREAMLCGVPVISTRSGGPEDTISEDSGMLVAVGDIQSIAEKLLAIYNRELVFKPKQLRNHVVCQSGRVAFLNRMKEFYKV